MIEDVLYKIIFSIMLIAFPLVYLSTGIINIVRYFRVKKNSLSSDKIHRLTVIANLSLIVWCLLSIIIYAIAIFVSNGEIFYDMEIEIWFYLPLLITIVLLLFRGIRKSVFAWIFFTVSIVTGWILYVTFLQLSLS